LAYNLENWKRRIAERTDMSTSLIHLTREVDDSDIVDVMFRILVEKKITGSTTASGYICGDTPAVCFQDIPLNSLCQNVFYEQKKIENKEQHKLRYRAFGFLFNKKYAFNKGVRPVIYDKVVEAKRYLPRDQWWKIVNLNLENNTNMIDWTHEREWRCPSEFSFELSEVTLLVIHQSSLKKLINLFKRECDIDLMNEIKGVVTLEHLLY
jgi:hypothetical protein